MNFPAKPHFKFSSHSPRNQVNFHQRKKKSENAQIESDKDLFIRPRRAEGFDTHGRSNMQKIGVNLEFTLKKMQTLVDVKTQKI